MQNNHSWCSQHIDISNDVAKIKEHQLSQNGSIARVEKNLEQLTNRIWTIMMFVITQLLAIIYLIVESAIR